MCVIPCWSLGEVAPVRSSPPPPPLLSGALSCQSLGIPLVGDNANAGRGGRVKLPGWRERWVYFRWYHRDLIATTNHSSPPAAAAFAKTYWDYRAKETRREGF